MAVLSGWTVEAGTERLELQVPVEFPHALTVGKSDVHGSQTSASKRQVPRVTVFIPGTGESGRDAWALVVRSCIQWRA